MVSRFYLSPGRRPQTPAGHSRGHGEALGFAKTGHMLEHGENIALIFALGLFAASVIGMRLVHRESRESRAPSPASPGVAIHRVPGAVGPSPRAGEQVYRQQWGTHAHLVEFVGWMRYWGYVSRYSAAEIFEYYLWFASDVSVEPIGKAVLLAGLADYPGIKKKRDRIKCPRTGKVLKLASGTPQRTRYYTIGEAPAKQGSAMAGRVPSGVRAAPEKHRAQGESQGRVPARAGPARARVTVANDPNSILLGYEVAA